MSVTNCNVMLKSFMKPSNSLNLVTRTTTLVKNGYCYSTEVVKETQSKPPQKKMSRAMLQYLERAKQYDEFIKKEKHEFEVGKRHLANMMGEDPEHFTQKQIDEAIDYLFPSGLYDKKARPMMKPPEEVYPPKKSSEFDETGRPFNAFFYTVKPNYYMMLHKIVEKVNELNNIEDKLRLQGYRPDPKDKIDLVGSRWLDIKELSYKLIEDIKPEKYEYFLSTLNSLAEHPYAHLAKDFIMEHRKAVLAVSDVIEILPIQYTDDGRPFVEVLDCMRKSSRGRVKVIANGTGLFSINGKDITYFEGIQEREQVIYPLAFAGLFNKVDVEAHVQFGGPQGQMGCIRWGIAWAIRSFVDAETIEKMRIAGLLTRDWRRRERKKPGQEGARRKFTWKKR